MKKYGMYLCAAIFLLILGLPVRARAAEDGFRVEESGLVTLDSSHAAGDGIRSLCFTLKVEPEAEGEVSFAFADSGEGQNPEVMEYRYQAEEGKLNIYMAGKAPLFQAGTESLQIGKVAVTGANGEAVAARVSVVEGSLQFVYGAGLRPVGDVNIPEPVRTGPAAAPVPTVTPPAATSSPSGQPEAAVPGDQGSIQAAAVPSIVVRPTASPAPVKTKRPKPVTPTVTAKPVEAAPTETPPAETPAPETASSEASSEEAVIQAPVGSQPGESPAPEEGGLSGEGKLALIAFLIAAMVVGIGAVILVRLVKKPED